MSLFEFFMMFVKVAVFTFGGGYAMVTLFQYEIVTHHALISAEQFANLVAIAQVTPGPIGLNAATFAGMVHGGIGESLVATLGMMVPSLTITLAAAAFLARHWQSAFIKNIMRGIRPCVLGIIAAAVVFFADTSIFEKPLQEMIREKEFGFCWQGVVIFVIVLAMRVKWRKLNPVWSVAISAVLGWALFIL